MKLSPRERQVLVNLLCGDSKTQIADSPGISQHTVEDYIKQIYKQFAVNTRAELHALFHLGRANRTKDAPANTGIE